MIEVETKRGMVYLDESMCGPAIKEHTPSLKIEGKEMWKHAKQLAEGVRKWWDENNGNFEGAWKSGYAIHHAQVCDYGHPYNFFVVDKKLTRTEWAKEIAKKDRSIRDITNIIFPDQVIYNPEIITATQTFMDDAVDERTGRRYKRGTANVMKYEEACMSYHEQTRKPKKMDRFYRIKVRYQIVKKNWLGIEKVETIEEWIQGLKAHIFQHEVDHALGIDVVDGKGNKEFPTLEERECEDGYTRKEIEEYTAKRTAEIEEKVQEKGVCLLQSTVNGRYYRVPTDLEELPEGFIEPDVIEVYDGQGNIKSPFTDVPWYTDPSAKREATDPGDAISFDGQKVIKQKSRTRHVPMITKKKTLEAIENYEPSKLDGCYYLDSVVFYELASRLASGNPSAEKIKEVYPDLEETGFTVHGMVFYPRPNENKS